MPISLRGYMLIMGCLCVVQATPLEPRLPYTIKLSRIQVSFNDQSRRFEYVRLPDPVREQNYAQIGPLNDYLVKNSNDGREKTEYREDPNTASLISSFEAEQMAVVCRNFENTLNDFENDLRAKNWGRLRYLDSYFPRFLRGYYYLYTAVRGTPLALPRTTRVADSLYDVSENSPKSDARIAVWRADSEAQIKLRMAAKELVFQMAEWRKKELEGNRRSANQNTGGDFENAFTLFVKIYFNQVDDASDDE